MKVPQDRHPDKSTGFPLSCSPPGLLRPGLLPVLLMALFLTGAGCLHAGQPLAGNPDSRSPGTDGSGFYLEQNVINTSAGSQAGADISGMSTRDRAAAAIAGAMDSRDPATRDFAVSLIPKSHGGAFNLAQICDLWEVVYSRWTYVDDPNGGDYFSPASRTITLGFKGDCDDFAIVLAAMIGSVGGDARVVYARNATTGHAYPEVYVGNTEEEFDTAAAYIRQRYHVTDVGCHITRGEDGPRYWLNLDWWSTHPGGKFFADDGVRTAYYPDGHWEQVES